MSQEDPPIKGTNDPRDYKDSVLTVGAGLRTAFMDVAVDGYEGSFVGLPNYQARMDFRAPIGPKDSNYFFRVPLEFNTGTLQSNISNVQGTDVATLHGTDVNLNILFNKAVELGPDTDLILTAGHGYSINAMNATDIDAMKGGKNLYFYTMPSGSVGASLNHKNLSVGALATMPLVRHDENYSISSTYAPGQGQSSIPATLDMHGVKLSAEAAYKIGKFEMFGQAVSDPAVNIRSQSENSDAPQNIRATGNAVTLGLRMDI